eukprot:scaffold47644_cov23-Tisochrysis_lutea.AAC.2
MQKCPACTVDILWSHALLKPFIWVDAEPPRVSSKALHHCSQSTSHRQPIPTQGNPQFSMQLLSTIL